MLLARDLEGSKTLQSMVDGYTLLHSYNRWFLEGKSKWTRQWGNSLMNSVAVVIIFSVLGILAALDFGNGAEGSGMPTSLRPFTLGATALAGSLILAVCLSRLWQHTLLCRRGQLLSGEVASVESTQYHDASGTKLTYRYVDSSGQTHTGVAEGPNEPTNFALTTPLCILLDNNTGFHAVL